jgi:hypothetical protein
MWHHTKGQWSTIPSSLSHTQKEREQFKSTAWVHSSSFPQKIHPTFVQDPPPSTGCTFEGSFHSQPEACNTKKKKPHVRKKMCQSIKVCLH